MTHNEIIIANALLFASGIPEFDPILDRLHEMTLESDTVNQLVTARVVAVLKNDRQPDIIGEFYKAGGTPEQYTRILEAGKEIGVDGLLPSIVAGAISRENGRLTASRLRPMLDALEMGRCTLEDVASAVMGEDRETTQSATLIEVMEAEKTDPLPEKLPTGFGSLDHHIGGLTRKHTTILAARPAVGKSDFALAVSRNVMRTGGSVYVASLEMDRREVMHRSKRGCGGEAHMLSLPGQMRIDDRAALTVPQIAAGVNAGDYDLVVVDHMQLLSYRGKAGSLYEKTTCLSNELRIAAKHSSAAWLVLSQLSRNTGDETSSPLLSHLRDSGAIEQDAFAVLFLHEPQTRDYSAQVREIAATVAKCRDGSSARVRFLFEMGASQWTEM